ncbi:MAG: hypothetical protein ACK4IX_05510 [Candidatus Sericytochromatia bacterium]
MKLSVQENDNEYKLTREMPYKELVNTDTLISAGIFFFILILVKLYILIPIIVILAGFASLQTTEDNFTIVVKKKSKKIIASKYYMGRWKVKEEIYDPKDFSFIQVEKQVTSIKEEGRFSIKIFNHPPSEDIKDKKDTKVVTLMKNLELEAIEHAKIISFFSGMVYDQKIKYKMGIT